jgi:predicted metal-dependent TIM-barrel fold hydrolase
MELEELHRLANLNELDLLYKLIEIAQNNRKDTEKILKGEKAAGIRVRDNLQDVKMLCEIIRDKIQIRKGIEWSTKRVSALDRAIKEAENKQIKDRELIEKKKQERLARFAR